MVTFSWIRARSVFQEAVLGTKAFTLVGFGARDGLMIILARPHAQRTKPSWSYRAVHTSVDLDDLIQTWHGFWIGPASVGTRSNLIWFMLATPYWFAWLATTGMSLALVIPFTPISRRARRETKRSCLTCGYDLRASEDRCPECGRPVRA